MKRSDASRIAGIRTKSNVRYTCQECGSTEMIQAHHQIPKDDSSLIALCAVCHSKKHPNIPTGLFFSKSTQPYWGNISAASLAKELGKNPRTICRAAKRLNIPQGILADEARERIIKTVLRILPKPQKAKLIRPKIPRGTLTDEIRERIDKALAHVSQTTGKQPCVVAKWIYGKPYLYQTRSERNGKKVRQIFVRYIGRAESLSIEDIVEKLLSQT